MNEWMKELTREIQLWNFFNFHSCNWKKILSIKIWINKKFLRIDEKKIPRRKFCCRNHYHNDLESMKDTFRLYRLLMNDERIDYIDYWFKRSNSISFLISFLEKGQIGFKWSKNMSHVICCCAINIKKFCWDYHFN